MIQNEPRIAKSPAATTWARRVQAVGAMPHKQIMRAIELFGTEVAPLVRTELARRAVAV